jgi:putative tryptophan/tyrosine transport system substrate-binding protein
MSLLLAGPRPGDLPIEQASRLTFVINLKTAKALGITVPPALLSLADLSRNVIQVSDYVPRA